MRSTKLVGLRFRIVHYKTTKYERNDIRNIVIAQRFNELGFNVQYKETPLLRGKSYFTTELFEDRYWTFYKTPKHIQEIVLQIEAVGKL
jgi:hypothetical protein